jgi:hypothetical protein
MRTFLKSLLLFGSIFAAAYVARILIVSMSRRSQKAKNRLCKFKSPSFQCRSKISVYSG